MAIVLYLSYIFSFVFLAFHVQKVRKKLKKTDSTYNLPKVKKNFNLELLSLKRINSHQPIREEELSNLVKWIASEQGSPINLTQAVISTVYTIFSKAAFGKKCKGQEKFISAVKESIKIAGGFDLADLFPSIR
ncbi:unnamed protein product [Vicia faba]|uniref:Uncharacterized protein n=1 Tax=Vicia faba TaxID=3906 RepID=A0AAV0YHK8_VICFA|nr:unnamed protein product [Vicia faba]